LRAKKDQTKIGVSSKRSGENYMKNTRPLKLSFTEISFSGVIFVADPLTKSIVKGGCVSHRVKINVGG